MKEVKRILSLVLTLVMICSAFVITNAEEIAELEKTVYSASADFGTVQGENNWYYLTQKIGSTSRDEFVYSEKNSAWMAGVDNWNRGLIDSSVMLPGTHLTSVFDAIRAFKSPKDGLISITAEDIGADNKNQIEGMHFGVQINIKKNDEIIWPNDGREWENLETREAVSAFNGVKIQVNADDYIYFTVRRNIDTSVAGVTASSLGENKVKFAPVIEYLDGWEIASEAFNPVQGEGGWSYFGRKPDGVNLFATTDYMFDTTQNAWISSAGGNGRGRIGADYMLPGVNIAAEVNIIREYTVSKSGTVMIDTVGKIGALNPSSEAAFGVKIRILNNGEKIYPAKGDWETLDSRSDVSAFEAISVNVSEGDKLIFEAGRTITTSAATGMLENIILWNPMIKYTYIYTPAERKIVYSDSFDESVNKEFWNVARDTDDNPVYTVENGALKGSSDWVRFYAPYAVNYSMSFDLTFEEFIAGTTGNPGFYMRVRRPNDNENGFYQMRFDTTKATNDIVWGYADRTGNFVASGSDAVKRVSVAGSSAWAEDTVYNVKVSVETTSVNDVLKIVVKNGDTVIHDVERTFACGTCPMGGGGFSVEGAKVSIDNFVLEGEPSESLIDKTLKFYSDDTYQDVLTTDIAPNGTVIAAIEKVAGFDDYSVNTPMTVILAAYDTEDRLVAVSVNEAKVTARHKYITASLNGDDITGAYKYKAYLFEDMATLKPIGEDAAVLDYISESQKKN